MKTMTATPLSSLFRMSGRLLPQTAWLPSRRPKRRRQLPDGHGQRFPPATIIFKVQGIEIEGCDDIGVDVQYPWEDTAAALPRASHAHRRVLHRQVSGHQRRVQEVPRCHALPSETTI